MCHLKCCCPRCIHVFWEFTEVCWMAGIRGQKSEGGKGAAAKCKPAKRRPYDRFVDVGSIVRADILCKECRNHINQSEEATIEQSNPGKALEQRESSPSSDSSGQVTVASTSRTTATSQPGLTSEKIRRLKRISDAAWKELESGGQKIPGTQIPLTALQSSRGTINKPLGPIKPGPGTPQQPPNAPNELHFHGNTFTGQAHEASETTAKLNISTNQPSRASSRTRKKTDTFTDCHGRLILLPKIPPLPPQWEFWKKTPTISGLSERRNIAKQNIPTGWIYPLPYESLIQYLTRMQPHFLDENYLEALMTKWRADYPEFWDHDYTMSKI